MRKRYVVRVAVDVDVAATSEAHARRIATMGLECMARIDATCEGWGVEGTSVGESGDVREQE
jgi:hypothetical protein